jgi:pimeloyl-ACP methyl ester carboxylesterase
VTRSTVPLFLLALVLGGCGGANGPKPVKAKSDPGYVVQADGHRVYFECEGKGSPTVVFVSGWGADLSSWLSVVGDSANLTRSCVYDRYGVGLTAGYGTLSGKARDADDQARELEQLLANAEIPGPYVLVGHSWGGALARYYAGKHDDVKGVVFVDSSSPGQDAALLEALPPKRSGEPEMFAELRQESETNPKPLVSPEHLDWSKGLSEVAEVTSLGKRPEVVITAGRDYGDGQAVLGPVWNRLQDTIAGLSSDSVHARVPGSGHFVQEDAPEVVEAAIHAVVKAVRGEGELPSCQAIFGGTSAAECVH